MEESVDVERPVVEDVVVEDAVVLKRSVVEKLSVVVLEGTEEVLILEQPVLLFLRTLCFYPQAWTSRQPYTTSGPMLRIQMPLCQRLEKPLCCPLALI
jgi:hypothetical protein